VEKRPWIAKHVLRVVHEIGLMAGISIIWTANVSGKGLQLLIGTPLPDLAQVVSPFELRAINDPARAFCVIDRFVTDAPQKVPGSTRSAVGGYITNEPAKPNIAPLGGAIYVRPISVWLVTDKRARTNREAVVHPAFYLICSDNDQVAPLANSLIVRS
jgi:hypothetical protein